jgi:hypothetical protein
MAEQVALRLGNEPVLSWVGRRRHCVNVIRRGYFQLAALTFLLTARSFFPP